MTSLQDTPGVTPYPDDVVARYLAEGVWGTTRIEDLLDATAARHPDAVAVVDDTETVTYWQLVARSVMAASVLDARGIRAGDNVVLQMPNVVDAIAVVLGAFRIGARPILALMTHRATEVSGFLERGRARHWIIGDLPGTDTDDLVREVTTRVGDPVEVVRWQHPAVLPQAPQTVPRPRSASADELAFFQLSGGTTGASKLIPRAHREYAYSFLRSNELCGVDESTVLVIPIPATHNFPMSSPGFLGVLAAGGTVVLTPHGDPDTICRAVERHQATHLVCVPPLAHALLDSHARTSADLSSLRRVLVGGARLSPAVARRVHTEIAPLQQVYGMAEGLVCYTDPNDAVETIVTTQGRPMSAHDEVRVVDGATEVAAGEVGELQVRGPYTIRGYYFGEAVDSFTADGYYRTGDLVTCDADGNITVVGRLKEQINRGGEKISPVEVENALLRHPDVHDACVVGEPDDVLGEKTVAYVVPQADSSGLDRRTLRRHLVGESLAPFKIPDAFRVVDTLPTTAVGKISRRDVPRTTAVPTRLAPETLDMLGVGFGPANMALAIAVEEENARRATAGEAGLAMRFVDAAPDTRWHDGLLLEGTSMQVAFVKDLVTMRNPGSDHSFLRFLHDRGRLADFVNRGSMAPLRIEFVEYLRWAADRLRHLVAYSTRVEAITPVLHDGTITGYDVDVRDAHGLTRHRTRHVAVAAGLVPSMPCGLQESERVWHSGHHLHRVADLDPGTREIVVVGGGQSAAEVTLDLHRRLPQARIHVVHSRFGLVPSDSSPYANRIFDPDTVDALFDAPDAVRAHLDALHANTNDAVVNPTTLAELYDLDYEDRWLGRDRLRWHGYTRVTGIADRPGAPVEVTVHAGVSGRDEVLHADAVVCATGYRPTDLSTLLGDHARLLRRDEAGRPLARRDYAATWAVPAQGHLFLVGQTRHQHGVSATLLSNVAVRAGEITAAILASDSESAGDPADVQDLAG